MSTSPDQNDSPAGYKDLEKVDLPPDEVKVRGELLVDLEMVGLRSFASKMVAFFAGISLLATIGLACFSNFVGAGITATLFFGCLVAVFQLVGSLFPSEVNKHLPEILGKIPNFCGGKEK